jgi:hypothetical protein
MRRSMETVESPAFILAPSELQKLIATHALSGFIKLVHAGFPSHHIFSAIESNGSNGLISSARILRRLIIIRS